MISRNNSNDPRIPVALQHVFLQSARGNEDVKPPSPASFKLPRKDPTASSRFRLFRSYGADSSDSTTACSTVSSPRRTLLSRMVASAQQNSSRDADRDLFQDVLRKNKHRDEECLPPTRAEDPFSNVDSNRSHSPENSKPRALAKQSSWADNSLDDTLPLEDRPRHNNKGIRRTKSSDDGVVMVPQATSKSSLDNSSHSLSGAALSPPRRQPRHAGMSPQQYLDGMMRNRGYSVDYIETLDTAYRSRPTPLQKASYHLHLVKLVKMCPASALHEIMCTGLSPNPCNAYGESLLHTVCRYSMVAHLQVLLEHCGTDLKVCDDFGRLPLHDACWANGAQAFATVDMILRFSKANGNSHLFLFHMMDARGSTPLAYVRQEQWGRWIQFLQYKKDEYWPALPKGDRASQEKQRACPLLHKKAYTRTLPDPPSALPLKLAAMVASGIMSPTEASILVHDAPYDTSDDDDSCGSISSDNDGTFDEDDSSDSDDESDIDEEEIMAQIRALQPGFRIPI